MRSLHHAPMVYLLSLIATFFFAGCVFQPKPVNNDMAPALKTLGEPAAPDEAETTERVYAPGDADYPEGYYVHTVRIPNENLTIIAKWYTNKQKNWLVLVKCNPDIKPNRIFIGDKIKIPRSLLAQEASLPAEFVHQLQAEPQRKPKKKITPAKPAATPPATPATPAAKEDPLLFGPKGF